MHGNLSLSGRDAISTPLLMIRDVANNTEYTVLVAAGVTVNKTINITGPWNTKSGMLVKSLLIVNFYVLVSHTVYFYISVFFQMLVSQDYFSVLLSPLYFTGCHGSCPMSWSTYFLIGGTVGGTLVLLILITLIVTFILLFM